jgi:hypothetical protein
MILICLLKESNTLALREADCEMIFRRTNEIDKQLDLEENGTVKYNSPPNSKTKQEGSNFTEAALLRVRSIDLSLREGIWKK